MEQLGSEEFLNCGGDVFVGAGLLSIVIGGESQDDNVAGLVEGVLDNIRLICPYTVAVLPQAHSMLITTAIRPARDKRDKNPSSVLMAGRDCV